MQVRQVSVGGKPVRILQGGSGKPLVFLHGWSTSPLANMESLEILARKFAVCAPFIYDLNSGSVSGIAQGISALIRQLGLSDVKLAGTSFGGLLAGMVAVSDNPRISRLALINSAGVPDKASLFGKFLDSLSSIALLLLQRKLKTLLYRAVSGLRFYWRYTTGKNLRKLAKETSASTHACYVFRNIKVKSAIVWSTNDVTFPASSAEVVHKLIANSTVTIIKGNHAWHYHKPELFAKTIMNALK